MRGWCMVFLLLMFALGIVGKCEAGEWVEPPVTIAVQLSDPEPIDAQGGLIWMHNGSLLQLYTANGELYAMVNLVSGIMVVDGPGVVVNGFCSTGAEGPDEPLDTIHYDSVVIGRIK